MKKSFISALMIITVTGSLIFLPVFGDSYKADAAVKKVKVTYKANDGKFTAKKNEKKVSYTKKIKKNQKIGNLPKIKRTGYSLKGWYYKKNSKWVKAKSSTKVKKNTKLHAKWNIKPTSTNNIINDVYIWDRILKYNSISSSAKDVLQIPGIEYTNINGKISINMCPQGYCQTNSDSKTGGYHLISAYDTKNKENSVIYVFKGKNNSGSIVDSKITLKATIDLGVKGHVGGLAYDYDKDRILVANWKDGTSNNSNYYAWIPLSKITGSNGSVKLRPGDFNKVYIDGSEPSFVTYHNNTIWAGTFNKAKDLSCITAYENYSSNGTRIDVGHVQLQGAAFMECVDGDSKYELVLSASYGKKKKSYLHKYEYDYKSNTLEYVESADIPPMVENIYSDDGDNSLYALYESGANSYRKNAKDPIDKVIGHNYHLIKWNSGIKKSTLSLL